MLLRRNANLDIWMGDESRIKVKKWSEREDSNLRPSAPKADALPNCATLRHSMESKKIGDFYMVKKIPWQRISASL